MANVHAERCSAWREIGVLSGQSILCFAPDPWNDLWRNRHQIMSLLAEQNRVLYIEPRPYLRAVVKGTINGRIPLSQWVSPRLVHVSKGLHVYRPPLYAPLSGREPLASLTRGVRNASLRGAMRRLNMDAPILWLYRPDMADLPGQCGERLVIYHIVDEYLGYADLDPSRVEEVRQRERELIQRADLVLVTSQTLLESKGGINPNTHWVPNAVDYARFAAACELDGARTPEPPELAGLARPRIGYVGALNDKIDFSLLVQVAEAYPAVPLVLVGPIRVTTEADLGNLRTLHGRPNVHFVDQVPVDRVPHYVAACDVGLLPYRRNAWTRNIHPLKMYEYLACGLAAVSTDIPGVRDEADLVHIAQDEQSFVTAIARALCEGAAELKRQRQQRASRNTWRQRVERISALIETTMQARGVS
jgi:glycosyltransferase involved in cell wall biosynthesis